MAPPPPSASGGSPETGPAHGARKDFLPELDGLRAIAVLLVLWSHLRHSVLPHWAQELAGFLLPHYLGVDLFFVLSGFLITRILLVDRDQGVPLRWFYARRCLRIFPIYYLLLAVLAVLTPEPALPWSAVYLSNFYIYWNGAYGMLDHTWSLCVEEHFYLLWPPLATWLSLRASRRVLLLGFLPFSLATGVWLSWRHGSFEERDFLALITGTHSLARFGSLAAGALIAYSEACLRARPWRSTGLALLLLACAWPLTKDGFVRLGGAHLVLASGLPGDPQRILPIFQLISFPLTSSAVLLLAIGWTGTGALHARLLRAAPLTAIGRISYGLYLYHYPLYSAFGIRNPAVPEPSLLRHVLGLGAILAIAALSQRFVERPILSLGRRFRA
jgi:peptidoglycan/LPS O-acetylase OafA/YrhL